MEIKGVKEEKIEYPTINEINDKKLKKCIPNKWMKLGITSVLFDILMRNKAFAREITLIDTDLAGGVADYNPIYGYVGYTCGIVQIISGLIFFVDAIIIVRTKLKAQKTNENVKVNKKLKIVFIISIILFILSWIGQIITNYLD